MSITRAIDDWKPYRFLPLVEYRRVGIFLDSAPTVLVDIAAIWTERRLQMKGGEA